MPDFRQQIRQQLIANIIKDKCARSEGLIFRDAWCTQDRVIRFTTPFFRELFTVKESSRGKWKTGDFVMYEIQNTGSALTVNCVLHPYSANYAMLEIKDSLLKAAGVNNEPGSDEFILKSWLPKPENSDPNGLPKAFDRLLEMEIPAFEDELKHNMESEGQEEKLHEGTQTAVTLNKYERNRKAREACLAAHGTACAVCGIDFGKVFGPEFAGKIEVHHIVPISYIGTDYIVDPVRDLVPVCPNCHTMLHSKKDGVYTVEELRHLLGKS